MRILNSIVGCLLCSLVLVGCADKTTAGIEIGNPEIALALTADFSVDYSDGETAVLSKSAAKNEAVLLDEFSLQLTQVRSFSSYYVNVSVDPALGLQLWPYEDSPSATLDVSFTNGSKVEDPFSDIDLEEEGLLKELGVGFKPVNGSSDYISGRILVGEEYVPFEYSLDDFQSFMLRYHYSQIERVSDSVANLSVVFRIHLFTDGVELSQAEISKDGVIYFDRANNTALWETLNARFLPSFQALRFEYTMGNGTVVKDYVEDIWNDVSGGMGVNSITNGDFNQGSKDWILNTQFNGFADTTLVKEKSGTIMKVDVVNGGRYSYSVQLIHENIPLVEGKRYKCVYTIWSDVEGEITARIGSYVNYETIGFQTHARVGTTGQSQEVEFTAEETTPFARFELNLGKGARTFWIKEAKIYRLDK